MELRLILWRFTWVGRVVILQLGRTDDATHDHMCGHPCGDTDKYIVYTRTRLPSALLVNSESRCETLKYYKLAFQIDNHVGCSMVYSLTT